MVGFRRAMLCVAVCSVLAAGAAVLEPQPQTDGSILAKVEGHRGGIVVGTTPRMIETPGGWKVGRS